MNAAAVPPGRRLRPLKRLSEVRRHRAPARWRVLWPDVETGVALGWLDSSGWGPSCVPLVPGWVVAEDFLDCAGPEVSVEYLDPVPADQAGMGGSAGVAELK